MKKAKTPDQVLKECGIDERPVPLEKILQFYKIQHFSLPANDDIFGAIMRQRGQVIIAVNPNQHAHRQRFTIAHELGHFFIHLNDQEEIQFVDGDFRLHWRNNDSSRGVNWTEIEANRFAAALLMPRKLLKEDVDRFGRLDHDVVQHLSTLYKVSRISMQYRLIHLGLLPPDVDPSS